MQNTIRNISEGSVIASDLNGTLTTGSPVLAVYRWLKANQPGATPPLFVYRLSFSYLLVKAGLLEIDTWGEEAMRDVLGCVRDPDPLLLEDLMEFVVEDELWPKRKDEPISLLRDFHHQGAQIWILSAAYQPVVEKFSQRIAPNRIFAIGTPVEITPDGLQFAGPLNSRDRKITNLLEKIGSRKLSIALGDTFADIPLLDKAEKAIVVDPDRKLKQKASLSGWHQIG